MVAPFRLLMAPALLVELDAHASRWSWWIVLVAWIATCARHPGGAAPASMIAIPRLVRVPLTHTQPVSSQRAQVMRTDPRRSL
jgi:hypothetical protein